MLLSVTSAKSQINNFSDIKYRNEHGCDGDGDDRDEHGCELSYECIIQVQDEPSGEINSRRRQTNLRT